MLRATRRPPRSGSSVADHQFRDHVCSPIAREAVAAGEGAFRTCTKPGDSWMQKSSSSRPSAPTAWARTPAPPGSRSAAVTSGTSARAERAYARRIRDRQNSAPPARQCRATRRQKPPKRTISAMSARLGRPSR